MLLELRTVPVPIIATGQSSAWGDSKGSAVSTTDALLIAHLAGALWMSGGAIALTFGGAAVVRRSALRGYWAHDCNA